MNLRTTFLMMTSATALVACRGDLRIGGVDSGVNPLGPPSDAAPSEPAQGDDDSSTVLAADSGKSPVADSGSSSTGASCASAGGMCVLGDTWCARQAPSSSQDCETDPPNPGGAFCCLALSDAGSPIGGICAPEDASATDVGDAMAPSCGCTRRPGPGASAFSCPSGNGENNSLALGPSGGTLTLEGHQGTASGVPASIDFSQGSVQTTTEITLVETGIAPPLDLLDWSPVYLVRPAGLMLGYPARIALPDSNGSSAGGIIQSQTPANLAIWFSPDGTCFTRLSDYALNAGFETGTISQLGYLIVASARAPSTASCP